MKQNEVKSSENRVGSAVNGRPASDKLRQVITDNPALVRSTSASHGSAQQPATMEQESTSEEETASEVQA